MQLKDFINEKSFIREAKSYSMGTQEECESLLKEGFLLTDKTNTFEMLPEYKEVTEWMSDTKGKGLLLTGSNGRGKSVILKGILPLIFEAKLGKILHPVNAVDLKKEDLRWCICIDDIGRDDIVFDFGTKIDAVEYAISHCEDRMKLLLLTSNLDKKQLVERYGVRIMDRIERLCKIVVFNGKSLRS